MMTLSRTLERFNRKERNLLIRDVLGHQTTPLCLSAGFRKRVAEKLNIAAIPSDAWWATDYHFGWLAGALSLYVQGDSALEKSWPNPKNRDRQLVEGNQEDVDLLIAWDNEIALIEAKAYGAFSNAQASSKLARLTLLHEHYEKLPHAPERLIRFHLLLMSPRPPQKLEASWPTWCVKGTGVPWIPLQMNVYEPALTVTRCNANGISAASGDHWRITGISPKTG